MELKDGIKQINQSVTQSSASDATLEGYMLELKDANGNLVDKQPVSKIESLVYNYLTTRRQSELAKVMSVQESLGGVNDNVFILYCRKSDNFQLMVKLDKWASYQSSGEVATGVAVVDGERVLVVAPTESESLLCWSSAAVSGGGKTTTDPLTANSDFDGKANTASQITHAEASGASYAAGYCAQYSRTNANGQGFTAGKWWLPSIGELTMMYANRDKINYALSLIEGATQLDETWYWSSTEYNATNAWGVYLDGGVSNYAKATTEGRIRAVSSISLNLPSFYKNYPDIASLAGGVGVYHGDYRVNTTAGTLNKYLKINMQFAVCDIYYDEQQKTGSTAQIYMGHVGNHIGKYVIQGGTSITAYSASDGFSLYILLNHDGFIGFDVHKANGVVTGWEIVDSLPSGATQISLT